LSENALLRAWRRKSLVEWGVVRAGRTTAFASEVIRGFDVRTTGPRARSRSLSGGNLQKFVVGAEILQQPACWWSASRLGRRLLAHATIPRRAAAAGP